MVFQCPRRESRVAGCRLQQRGLQPAHSWKIPEVLHSREKTWNNGYWDMIASLIRYDWETTRTNVENLNEAHNGFPEAIAIGISRPKERLQHSCNLMSRSKYGRSDSWIECPSLGCTREAQAWVPTGLAYSSEFIDESSIPSAGERPGKWGKSTRAERVADMFYALPTTSVLPQVSSCCSLLPKGGPQLVRASSGYMMPRYIRSHGSVGNSLCRIFAPDYLQVPNEAYNTRYWDDLVEESYQ